jgi:ubiquitin carboxyl-terminal hydrolase 9/24
MNALSRNCLPNLDTTIDFLTGLHKGGVWRTKKSKDWEITSKQNEKSYTGYIGIYNLGCICYMNSLF